MDKIIPALIKAKSEFKELLKSAVNPAFKINGEAVAYSTLDDVATATAPLINNGLMLSQQPINIDGKPWLKAVLYHESGQSLDMGELPLSTIGKVEILTQTNKDQGKYPKFKNIDSVVTDSTDIDAQKLAASVTYARRVQQCAIFGLNGDIDDDGNVAANRSMSSSSNSQKTPASARNGSTVNPKQLYAAGMSAFDGDAGKLTAYLRANGVPSGNTIHITDLDVANRLLAAFKAMKPVDAF